MSGLFLRLFEYTIAKDEKLAVIVKSIPKVARYTSPDIQNEAITIMAKLVQDEIVAKVNLSDIPYFTIKVDGTKDPTGTENISIVVRAVRHGAPFEHLVTIATTVDLDAKSISTTVLDSLRDMDLNPQNIISQCYNGASFMSGKHGGVFVKIQEHLQKDIPYVHCYNHQLHLVVVHSISENTKVQKFFDICSTLFNFTRRQTIAAMYDGNKLKRLLDQRWTGHLLTTVAILDNYKQIIELLRHCAASELSADISVQASGLLANINTLEFLFIAKFIRIVLTVLEPANNSLQSKTMDLLTTSDVIDSVLKQGKALRDKNKFDELFLTVFGDNLNPCNSGDGVKRKIARPTRLDDFVILEHFETRSQCAQGHPEVEMCSLYNSVLDRCVAEIEARFSASNVDLLRSLRTLASFDGNFLSVGELQKLATLCDVDMQKCTSEIETARLFFLRKNDDDVYCLNTLHKLTAFAYAYRDAFPNVYRLLAAGLTIGASTSTCEATFSTLTRVLTPYRRSMLHARKANLILLAYEHETMNKIQPQNFLRCFQKLKDRRLQLF